MNAPERLSFTAPAVSALSARLDRRDARVLIVATLGLWTVHWLMLSARAWADGQSLLTAATAVRAALALTGAGLCYLIQLGINRMRGASLRARMLAAAAAAIIAADIYGWINAALASWLFGQPIPDTNGATVLILGYYAWTFFAWTTLYLALVYNAQAARAEHEAVELSSLAHLAQLRALQYQLNPHFLFNTLNSLSGLILDRRIEDANEMVERLSTFLRSSLTSDPLAMIPLVEEIRLQELYLRIEQVRFPDLRLSVAIAPDAEAARVPALILQPIVENSIRHAVSASTQPTHINLVATVADGSLRLTVTDDGSAPSARPGTGLGLRNVRDRLAALYGGAARLDARPDERSGFVVKLDLPLELG